MSEVHTSTSHLRQFLRGTLIYRAAAPNLPNLGLSKPSESSKVCALSESFESSEPTAHMHEIDPDAIFCEGVTKVAIDALRYDSILHDMKIDGVGLFQRRQVDNARLPFAAC